MIELFKLMFKGFLTILMSPFIAVAYVLFIVFAIVNHLVCEIVGFVKFISGNKSILYEDSEMLALEKYRNELIEKNNPFSKKYQGGAE